MIWNRRAHHLVSCRQIIHQPRDMVSLLSDKAESPFAENASPAKRDEPNRSSATFPTSGSVTTPDDMLSDDQIVVPLEIHRWLSADVENY
ncbi:hypothetical protein IE4872_PC00286 (plasmid) [Rhizobium gallicum]|uniref:Uncharacterized protein n=1 Tax=Rhizobium gallicum TaxID=56730 RepID=A0A1L5NQY0_9HYPH|nr:hypothetical protein IE4872_PC00286 [Rhizobium gallicum]